ncbi:MAG: hypothetical protein NUV80_05975 [Candidatus Berkelbacteria bacterium]|nr:hypothetical protein [Candidatus Berkelbacteria bacterium]
MATIHFEEICKILKEKGNDDAIPDENGKGYFVEILFKKPGVLEDYFDEEFSEKVITAECDLGSVTILFDKRGCLDKIEIC